MKWILIALQVDKLETLPQLRITAVLISQPSTLGKVLIAVG